MKSFILNIKNLFPYLLLIAIYFFFVNLEARNSKNSFRNNILFDEESNEYNKDVKTKTPNLTISIPVIPYIQKD
tara:strand:- start:5686 stop:5907 length:222 start_codon:yes stop_codon:yes gene_type:complete